MLHTWTSGLGASLPSLYNNPLKNGIILASGTVTSVNLEKKIKIKYKNSRMSYHSKQWYDLDKTDCFVEVHKYSQPWEHGWRRNSVMEKE